MTADTQRLVDESATASRVRAFVYQIRVWFAASWLANTSTALADTLSTAATTSTLANAGRTLSRWTRHSYCYRWLTKEPDPDVIVIDLRETYTVGPLIRLLDRLTPVLERIWRGSFARRALERVRTAAIWTWVADSRAVRLIAAALEPPEPPETRDRE